MLCKRTNVVPNGQNWCVLQSGQNYCVSTSGLVADDVGVPKVQVRPHPSPLVRRIEPHGEVFVGRAQHGQHIVLRASAARAGERLLELGAVPAPGSVTSIMAERLQRAGSGAAPAPPPLSFARGPCRRGDRFSRRGALACPHLGDTEVGPVREADALLRSHALLALSARRRTRPVRTPLRSSLMLVAHPSWALHRNVLFTISQ